MEFGIRGFPFLIHLRLVLGCQALQFSHSVPLSPKPKPLVYLNCKLWETDSDPSLVAKFVPITLLTDKSIKAFP